MQILNITNNFIKEELIPEKKKIHMILFYTFLFGIVAHGNAFFNANFTHDSLHYMVVGYEDNDFMISLGRFMWPLYSKFRGNIASPVLIGFITLIFIGLSSYLMIKLLDIKKKSMTIACCGFLVTNYTVSLTFATYINDADGYAISLFLVVLAVYIMKKYKYGFIISIPSIVVSLGIYQANFQVGVTVLMIMALISALKNEDAKTIFLEYFRYVIFMFIGIVLYYVIYIVVLKISGVSASTTYNGIPELKDALSIDYISKSLRLLFLSEKEWFMGKNNHHDWMVFGINTLFLLMCLYDVVCITIKNRVKTGNIILILIIIALFPIGMNVIGLMSNGGVHDIMTYSFFLFYILVFKMFEYHEELKGKELQIKNLFVVMCVFSLITSNVVYSNEIYVEKELIEQSTLSLMTRVIDRMEQTDGYKVGETKVVFMGAPVLSSGLAKNRPNFLNSGTGTGVPFSITYYEVYQRYFDYYLSYPINLLDKYEMYDFLELEEENIKKMKCFPREGSVQFIDDTLVIKFADID